MLFLPQNEAISKIISIDRQSKDLGSNPSAVESVFFSTERFSNSLSISKIICKIVTDFLRELNKVNFQEICQLKNICVFFTILDKICNYYPTLMI